MKDLPTQIASALARTKLKIEDFLFEQASLPLRFLEIVLWLRFGIFIILVINFRLLLQHSFLAETLNEPIFLTLFVYLGFIIYLFGFLHFNRTIFVNRRIQILQIMVDTLVVMTLYVLSGDPESDLFLLLFLPVLVLARFFDWQGVSLFMILIAAITIVVGSAYSVAEEFYSFLYWFQNLLPRFGFLFILSFFYLIYYRRRGIEDHLRKSAASLVDGLGELWTGNFLIDRSLNIVWADDAIRSRHKIPEGNSTCADVFCRRSRSTYKVCDQCPVAVAFQDGASLGEHRTVFVDREGIAYSAGLRITPHQDEHGNILSAAVRIRDLDQLKDYERRLYSYAENFERVSDTKRNEERDQLNALTQKLNGLTEALETLPSSDLERAITEVLLAATRQLNAQVVILSKPVLDVQSGQMGLQISFQSGLPTADAQSMTFVPLESNSLAAKALKRGVYQSVEDLTNSSHPYYLPVLRRNNLHAQACFPLKTEGQTIGVISLFRKWARGFSTEEMELGQAFANIVALMIASRDAISQTSFQAKERQRLLGTLESLGHSLSSSGRPQDLAQRVADFTCQTLHTETAALFLKEGDLLHRVAISGLEAEWFSDECYRIGHGLTGLAVLADDHKPHGQLIIDNHVPQSQLVIPEFLEIYRRKLNSREVQHLVAVPINGQNGPFGVLRILNKLTEEGSLDTFGFTEQDVETLVVVANSVGTLLENSRRLLKQRILTELAQGFTASLSYQEVLQKSLEQAVQLLHAELGFILLRKENTNELVFEVTTGPGAYRLQKETLPEGHGMAYEVLQSCEPQLVTDADRDDRFEGWLYRRTGLQVRSLLSVPIRSPDEVIGVLELASEQPSTFSMADASLLADLTPWIGIAISKALQYQAQLMRAEFLSRLQARLQEIGSATAKKVAMNSVAQAASELMECEFAGVALYDKDRQEIYALPDAGYVGVPQNYVREFHFSIDRPGGQVLREGKVHTIEDASRHPPSIFGRRLIEPLEARGVIAAPLLAGNHIVGILYAASRTEHRWTEDQCTFFSILAKHSAIAIRNAELQDRRERRAQLLNLVHEISIAGQATNDINLILNIILTAITAEYGLRFNRALILLYDKRQGVLRGFAGIGQLEPEEAHYIWENLDLEEHNMKAYVREVLKKRSVPYYTALHYKTSNLVIPVDSGSGEVIGRVLRTRQAEMVDARQSNVLINPDFFNLMQPGIFLATPLLANDEAVGVLVVDNKFSGAPIDEIERELLISCASQAAAAIQRSNLHRKLEQQVKALDHLQQVVRSFSEIASPDQALRRIALAAKELLHADISQLIPYNAPEEKLLVEAAVGAGYPETFKHDPKISEHGLTRRVLDGKSDMLVVENLESLSDLNGRFAREFGIKSVLGCRLEFAEEIVGVLYVDYSAQHRFDTAELEILRTLARHAAIAIHNSRLMEENRSLAAQAERSRLREDLHDILHKLQFKISAEAESIYEKLRHRRAPALTAQAEELWLYARHIYEQLERILEDMADPTLTELGLPQALRNLLAEFDLPLEAISVQGESRASPDVELMFYRICQEAVANIVKHAQLPLDKRGLMEIRLEQARDHTRLIVRDHGCGFAPQIMQNKRASIGLDSMRTRAHKVNGIIHIEPRPGEGVTIEVVAPRKVKENQ